jgi:hypothetical protein
VGRVWPRHGHHGRPLNSVVRLHLNEGYFFEIAAAAKGGAQMTINPKTVRSPRARLKLVRVLYDNGPGGWSMASVEWDRSLCVAIRWNGDAKNPLGNPQSRGMPTWFILPDEIGSVAEQIVQTITRRKRK